MSPRFAAPFALAWFAATALSTAGCGGKRIHGNDNGGDDAGTDAPIDATPPIDAFQPPPIPADCMAAAEHGLAWLVTQQNPDGSWGSGAPVATTAFAVLKIETYAREVGQSPFAPGFVYATQVAAGLRYLFERAEPVAISPQVHGNPDSNGNGRGLLFSHLMYENAITAMAIVAGAEPDRVVNAPGSNVQGRSYRAVAEDALDYLNFGQSDATSSSPEECNRGGWRYEAFDNDPSVGDNSVSQFVTLALEYARNPAYGYQIAPPAFVMTELRDWVTCMQNRTGGLDDGASGYVSGFDLPNAYKTGALLQQFAFLGDLPTAPQVMASLAYLQRIWPDTSGAGWRGFGGSGPSDYLAMYSIMKSLEALAISDLGGIDWYRQFCDQLKAEQNPDGSWPAASWDNEPVGNAGLNSTEWALLVLERAAPPPEVIP
jgi:hypothetical protein